MRNEPDDLCADVETVDGVNVQAIEQRERRLDASLFVIE